MRKYVAPCPGRQTVFEHRREHAAGIPHVDEVHGQAPVDRQQQRGEHPDPVADRRAHEQRRPTGLDCTELADLCADGAMGVHHPLRVRRRPRRVRDQGGRRRVDGGRRRDRFVGDELGEREVRARIADDRDPFEVGQVGTHRIEVGDEVEVAERVGGHERLHSSALQDVQDLLRSVEVHDRHDDRAEVGTA